MLFSIPVFYENGSGESSILLPKTARMSSIFLPSHPSPPTMRNGGRGSISRAKVKFLPFLAPFGGVGSICPDIPLGRELSLHGQDRFAPGRHGEQFCFRPGRTH